MLKDGTDSLRTVDPDRFKVTVKKSPRTSIMFGGFLNINVLEHHVAIVFNTRFIFKRLVGLYTY